MLIRAALIPGPTPCAALLLATGEVTDERPREMVARTHHVNMATIIGESKEVVELAQDELITHTSG
jgi:hypothetical protein